MDDFQLHSTDDFQNVIGTSLALDLSLIKFLYDL